MKKKCTTILKENKNNKQGKKIDVNQNFDNLY